MPRTDQGTGTSSTGKTLDAPAKGARMMAISNRLDVVRVIEGFSLIEGRGRMHPYRCRGGIALAPGLYAVCRPATASDDEYDDAAEFRGPFTKREDAEAAVEFLKSRMILWSPKARKRPRREPPRGVMAHELVAAVVGSHAIRCIRPLAGMTITGPSLAARGRIIRFTGGKN